MTVLRKRRTNGASFGISSSVSGVRNSFYCFSVCFVIVYHSSAAPGNMIRSFGIIFFSHPCLSFCNDDIVRSQFRRFVTLRLSPCFSLSLVLPLATAHSTQIVNKAHEQQPGREPSPSVNTFRQHSLVYAAVPFVLHSPL